MNNDKLNNHVALQNNNVNKLVDDVETILNRLKDCIEVHPDNYEDIEKGTWIKYINSKNEYRSGGVLIKNEYPQYFLLRNPYTKYMWKIELENITIFLNNKNNYSEEMLIKNNLYKLYKEGYIKILDSPDPEFLNNQNEE